MIVALFLVAQATIAEARPIALRSEVAPEPFTLGQPLAWTLEVEHEARDVYTLPEVKLDPLAATGPVETRRAQKEGHAVTTFVVHLTDTATLEPKLPDVSLQVQGPEGPRQVSIRGRPLQLRSLVKEEGEPNAEHAHHGPKPPVAVMVRAYLWLWLLIALAAVVAAIFAWRWWQKKRLEQPVFPAAPPLAVEDEALKRLVAVRENGAWGRQTIFAVSEIVRTYLGKRYHFNAIDLTTEELLVELKKRELAKVDLSAFEAQVRAEDLIKYAKVEPTQDDCRRSIDYAVELVNKTRPPRESTVLEAA